MDKRQKFERAVESYSDMITALCLLRLGNMHDAEDCYQNVFLKLYKHSEMLDVDSEYLKAWLIRTAVNECKNHFRFLSRHKTEQLDFINIFYEDEHERLLIEQIMSLPPAYREVIYLHYYSGYSVNELSQMFKIGVNTIKSRLKRGRDILKSRLGE